ncbi:MAG: phosphatidylglycerol lysyltransferase domain-containing protein [Acidobacteria bacterium]|nr:phosphatidylglycerol lysyltransferase domain-containing protein [Acidobacteriota bacterium]
MFDAELIRYGYLLLFAGVAIEADGFLIAGAFLAARGYFDIRVVLVLSALASTLANQFWFRLTRFRGRAFFESRIQNDRRFQRISGWLRRRDSVLIFLSRFLYGFRVAIPAAYGATGVSAARFTWLDALSACVWSAIVGFAGFALGDTLRLIVDDVRKYEWIVLLSIALGVGFVFARRKRHFAIVVEAVRKPFDAGADSALRLFTLVQHVARLLVVHAHGRVAAFAGILGALNIITAVFHTRLVHLRWLTNSLPFEVSRGSRALMLLAGIGLIYLARGLARRKRMAWLLAFGLASSSALLYVGQNASIVRAGLAALFATELWRQRTRFHARTDPVRLTHALVAAPVLALAVSIYGVAGLHQTGHPSSGFLSDLRATWRAAGFGNVSYYAGMRSPEAFVWSLRLLLVVSAGYVLTAAFAPVAWRRYRSAIGESVVATLALEHGVDSISYFAKQADKRHFTVDDRAFIGFRVKNRVAIAAGDPVGHRGSLDRCIEAFVEVCRTNDWIPVFYEASDRHLEAYRRAGLRWFKIGEEAVLDLPTWSLEGGKIAKVRQFINKVKREAPGLTIREYERSSGPDPGIDDQLEDISSEWLARKKGGEMGFNLGVFRIDDLADKRTLIAKRADGRVDAFVTWLPYRAGRAVVLDAMRYREDAQPGIMDMLIAESALLFKKGGLQAASLAMAPMANADDEAPVSRYDKGVRLIFEHFSSVYGYRTLFQYKKKFTPKWEPRYLVFPSPHQLLRIGYALVAVHYARK